MWFKKRKKKNKNAFFHALMLAVIWNLAICLFVVAAFSYGMKNTPGIYAVKYSNQAKINAADQENLNQEIYLRKLREKVENYVRENIVSLSKANNAGEDGLAVENISFINDDRALIFYGGGVNNDRYLAEIVFGEDNGQVKIDRFILKVKNDTDYFGGLYGAD